MTFSIARLNRLPKEERDRIYLELVPRSIFENYQIDPKTLLNKQGAGVVRGIFPPDDNFACIEVQYRAGDKDCIFSCQVSLETFMQSLHLDFLIIIDALGLKSITTNAFFYHNAILWEKYGFTYFRGGKMMEGIHKEFQPGGLLYEGLDDSTPFRMKGMEKTIRGRSWAVYDGLYADALDEEWESPIW